MAEAFFPRLRPVMLGEPSAWLKAAWRREGGEGGGQDVPHVPLGTLLLAARQELRVGEGEEMF